MNKLSFFCDLHTNVLLLFTVKRWCYFESNAPPWTD